MIEAWYAIVSFMLVTYVVMDGRNFGAGILHHFVARTPAERRLVLAAVGSSVFWDEVWLISFGGLMVAAFPQVMASAFSGYYLALFLILWCLIFRGISVEVSGHINDRLWRSFWDFFFSLSSFILAVVFGAAGGNVARGVPLDPQGNFSMAFFTDFGVRGYVGILDWYTVSIGLFAVVMLSAHGAVFLAMRTEGPVHDRSLFFARRLWLVAIPFFVVISLETLYVRPEFAGQLFGRFFSWVGILIIAVSAVSLLLALRQGKEARAFYASGVLIAGLLGTGAATIFPVMLYSTLDPASTMTAYTSASTPSALFMASIWWPIAFVLNIAYFVYLFRYYTGKVQLAKDNQDYE